MRKITFEEFVSRAKEIHGDKYVCSKQNFVDMRTKMVVHCTKHGQFSVIPYDLLQGHGCRKCDIDKKRYLLYGVALNDVYGAKKTKAYKRWYNILIRCYDEKIKAKRPTYAECLMCEEWLTFSNFKKWFDEHYVENYQIDKDILVKGNKLYSPKTCCFVPNRINTLLINRTNDRGNESIGVAKSKYGRYESYVSINGKRTHLGTFDTELQAFQKYKQVKEDYIKGVAKIYYQEGKINLRVYEALMRYEVNIDD